MTIKTRKIKADIDRRILTGMLVSAKFIQAVKPLYHPEYFRVNYVNTVARWCFAHHEKYNVAPQLEIHNIIESQKRQGFDDAQMDMIEAFVESLDLGDEISHAEKFNVEYLLDQTVRLFKERALENLQDDIKLALNNGDIENAEKSLINYKKPERVITTGRNPIGDLEAYKKAFAAKEEPLFHLPGALGDMLNSHFVRGGFFALLGRIKIGKTWRMMDWAFRALQEKCNVAFFQMGDLDDNDFQLRQAVFFAHKSWDWKYCQELNIPILDCVHNQKATCPHGMGSNNSVYDEEKNIDKTFIGEHKPCIECYRDNRKSFEGTPWWEVRKKVEPLTYQEAYEADRKWASRYRFKKGFKLTTYPNSSQNVRGIEHQLDMWDEMEGFVPDVIIIDYADIMAPENPKQFEKRHQEDERWRAMRRLSQERHCLVLVVTQSNRSGFEEETLRVIHTGEDARKAAHVTAFFSLNQTEDEEEQGIIRVASMGVTREGKACIKKQVCVLQSLETGRPCIASYYKIKEKKNDNDGKK